MWPWPWPLLPRFMSQKWLKPGVMPRLGCDFERKQSVNEVKIRHADKISLMYFLLPWPLTLRSMTGKRMRPWVMLHFVCDFGRNRSVNEYKIGDMRSKKVFLWPWPWPLTLSIGGASFEKLVGQKVTLADVFFVRTRCKSVFECREILKYYIMA